MPPPTPVNPYPPAGQTTGYVPEPTDYGAPTGSPNSAYAFSGNLILVVMVSILSSIATNHI